MKVLYSISCLLFCSCAIVGGAAPALATPFGGRQNNNHHYTIPSVNTNRTQVGKAIRKQHPEYTLKFNRLTGLYFAVKTGQNGVSTVRVFSGARIVLPYREPLQISREIRAVKPTEILGLGALDSDWKKILAIDLFRESGVLIFHSKGAVYEEKRDVDFLRTTFTNTTVSFYRTREEPNKLIIKTESPEHIKMYELVRSEKDKGRWKMTLVFQEVFPPPSEVPAPPPVDTPASPLEEKNEISVLPTPTAS